MQYALKVVGPHGAVVGIDRDPLPQAIPGARVLQGDAFTTPDAELLGPLAAFDVVLSDMAPNTTGVRATDQARSAALFEEALGRAERMLAPGGAFVGKIFQGPDLETIRRRMATRFHEIKTIKPEGSRAQSIEIYLAGKGFG
jgi:23S rRNA (uridine2552-2'-O)-methyltransferase